jgi:signal transduction histidine kinase
MLFRSWVTTKAQFRINISEAAELMSVKSFIYSIFYNLISNSIKFRRSHGVPMIEITSERYSGKTRIRIRDNGIGIDIEKYKEQLFAPYKRFHPYISGKGLGLFMVKTQMEKLGGTIDLMSAPNQGTEVILEFPE